MKRLEHATVLVLGWTLAVLAGEMVALLLAGGVWPKSPTAASYVAGVGAGLSLAVAPFAARRFLAEYRVAAGSYERMWQHISRALDRQR